VTDPQFETISESKAQLAAFFPVEIDLHEGPLDEDCLAKAQRDLIGLLRSRFPKANDNAIENVVKKASDAMRSNPPTCRNTYTQACGSPHGDCVQPRKSGTHHVRCGTSRKKFGFNRGGRIRRPKRSQRGALCFHRSRGPLSPTGPPTCQNIET